MRQTRPPPRRGPNSRDPQGSEPTGRDPGGRDPRPRGGNRSESRLPAERGRDDRSRDDRGRDDRGRDHRGQADRGPGDRAQLERGRGGREPERAPGADRAARPAPDETGAYWLHGQHAVAAALANPARRLRRLLLTTDSHEALSKRVPLPWRIQPERAERGAFAEIFPEDTVHQGIALLAEPLTPPRMDRVLESSTGPVLVLDQVTDPRNVGAILRSAAAFGAAAVLLQERHAPPETGALARAASGALELVPVLREVNIARSLEALKKAGLWVVGLDSAAPVTLAQSGLGGRRVALVLGAEGEGMRRLTREHCDELVRLPITPDMESLNVSAAAAVALYELVRS